MSHESSSGSEVTDDESLEVKDEEATESDGDFFSTEARPTLLKLQTEPETTHDLDRDVSAPPVPPVLGNNKLSG